MKIVKVQWKNFASYGNRLQTIEFDENSNLYLILGSTGAGKSTVAKVITYLSYGKVEGANLKDLPNRVNKGLWGKIWIESKGNKIVIERGISPGIFTVELNGEPYDVAGKSNVQEFLETEIYEIPYHVFKNVIILSVNDFKSFITMSPYDKKQIVDRIFGFSVINKMREIVKSKRKEIESDIRTFEDEIRTLDESITEITKKIEDLNKINNKKNKSKINEFKKNLLSLNKDRIKLKEVNEKIKVKAIDSNCIVSENTSKKSELNTKIRSRKKALKLYDNKTCPTCKGSLDSEFHVHIKKETQEELESFKSKLSDVETSLITHESLLHKLRGQSQQIFFKIGEHETQMKRLKADITNLCESNKSSESTNLKELITDFSKKKEVKDSKRLGMEGDDYYYSVLSNILGEDGLKNMALRTIIPSFNKQILLMSKEMGIPFIIKFDEKFNCDILHLGSSISPKTLSTGERKKVDFVVILALINMIKVRFPSLNILFLDEIFSSIDPDGVYHIIHILHNTIRELGLNTFVINHTVLPSEYFDKKLEISKASGFSEINIQTIV
tara:strand:- start:24678 stop:26345 length:1668 start_codon:yes stop_codon:yes gene_type:complete